MLIAFGTKHIVYREARADIAKQFYVVEIKKPVRIIHHQRFAVREVNETAHLLFEAVAVMLYLLGRHHVSHVRAS